MLPAHTSICLIEHRHQLPLLCSKTRNNRVMLKAWWPQERRRALLSRSGVPGAPVGGMVVAASPKQSHFLTRTWDGAGMMWTYFLFSPWWGTGEGRAGGGCVTIVTTELKTLCRKLNLITDRERCVFRVKNTGGKVTEGNVETTSESNIKSTVTATSGIRTLWHPLTAHTLKWQVS